MEWGAKTSTTYYFFGFLFSLGLIFLIYFAAVDHWFSYNLLPIFIISIAFLQMLIQFFFFFQLPMEKSPYWHTVSFLFMLIIAFIIVMGSLWIMHSLDYRVMTGMDLDHMKEHEGI